MNKRRVVFMGNRNLAVQCLQELIQWDNVELVGVVACHYDQGETDAWYRSVKRFALDNHLPLYQPKSVNQDEFLAILNGLAPDLVLSVHYDRILRGHVLSIPRLGAVNIHFAPLPRFRGSFPLVWAILLGESAGVTMHYMDTGIDTGDIIAQQEFPTEPDDTARTVYDKAVETGFGLFTAYLPLVLDEKNERRSQDRSRATYFPPGYPYERWIDWSRPVTEIHRFVRALTFSPYPSARTKLGDLEVECLHPVRVIQESSMRLGPGDVESVGDDLIVGTGAGLLSIRTLRVDGIELPARAFAELHELQPGTRVHSPVKWQLGM